MSFRLKKKKPRPIPMILHCPGCGAQHIDEPEECSDEGCPHYGTPHSHTDLWQNPPHKEHKCRVCEKLWTPANVPTMGVKELPAVGKPDFYKNCVFEHEAGDCVGGLMAGKERCPHDV